MRNSLMTHSRDPLWNLMLSGLNETQMRRQTPYDVKETEDKYLLALDLPGVPSEQVKVDVLERLLTISGERNEQKFSFRFTLPERANLASLEARLENGVLQISVPKQEAEKPRSIPVISGKAS